MSTTTEPLANISVGDTVRLTNGEQTFDAKVIAKHYRHFVTFGGPGELRFDYHGYSVKVNYKKVERTGEWQIAPVLLDGRGVG